MLIAAAGFLVVNSLSIKNKINSLRERLKFFDSNPPQRNTGSWINWIQTALDFTSANKDSLQNLWMQGGSFFNKTNAPNPGDVDLLINRGDVHYNEYA